MNENDHEPPKTAKPGQKTPAPKAETPGPMSPIAKENEQMIATIIEKLIKPLLHRVGTIAGTALLTIGATTQQVETIVAGGLALLGLALDLVLDHKGKK